MKIYKYKDLSDLEKLPHFYQIVLENKIWCAKPDSLNDKDEFIFKFDSIKSLNTDELLLKVIKKNKYKNANHLPLHYSVISKLKLENIVNPIRKKLIKDMRSTIGVACFSELRNDDNLWDAYGGKGNGICIEISIPDELINVIYHRINYVKEKIFHIDTFLEADLFKDCAYETYRNFLLTKTETWSKEKEIRFIAKRQEENMIINNGCYISEIIFGKRVLSDTLSKIESNIIDHCRINNIIITKLL